MTPTLRLFTGGAALYTGRKTGFVAFLGRIHLLTRACKCFVLRAQSTYLCTIFSTWVMYGFCVDTI
jgi:hypothetical protein